VQCSGIDLAAAAINVILEGRAGEMASAAVERTKATIEDAVAKAVATHFVATERHSERDNQLLCRLDALAAKVDELAEDVDYANERLEDRSAVSFGDEVQRRLAALEGIGDQVAATDSKVRELSQLVNGFAQRIETAAVEPNSVVRVAGLKTDTYNGKVGTVVSIREDGRARVLLEGAEQPIAVKSENLVVVAPTGCSSCAHSGVDVWRLSKLESDVNAKLSQLESLQRYAEQLDQSLELVFGEVRRIAKQVVQERAHEQLPIPSKELLEPACNTFLPADKGAVKGLTEAPFFAPSAFDQISGVAKSLSVCSDGRVAASESLSCTAVPNLAGDSDWDSGGDPTFSSNLFFSSSSSGAEVTPPPQADSSADYLGAEVSPPPLSTHSTA